MTQRHFYRDPLAAAWQAKHFGMRFTCYFPATGRTNEVALPAIETHIHTGHLQIDGKFAVHPDSHALLEPRAGDLCLFRPHRFVRVEEQAQKREIGGKPYSVLLVDGFYEEASYFESIVQRYGVAFVWPEREA